MSENSDAKKHEGHRGRLREMIRTNGVASLHPHQLLEYLLFYPIKRRDTNEFAHNLLERFGTLDAVFSAPVEEIAECGGLGPTAAIFIKLTFEIYSKYGGYKNAGRIYLSNPMITEIYFTSLFSESKSDEICAVILSSDRAVLNYRRYKKSLRNDSPEEISREIKEFFVGFYDCSCVVASFCHDRFPEEREVAAALKIMELVDTKSVHADSFVFADASDVMFLNRKTGRLIKNKV